MLMSDYTVKTELTGLTPPIKGSQRQAISLEIEDIYNSCPEMTYLEACLFFVEEYDYEYARFPNLINETLKDKIETEAVRDKTIKTARNSGSSLDLFV